MSRTYVLTFQDASTAEANKYAAELQERLLDASRDISVARIKSDANTQDLGTTLVLVLGAPAVVAAVRTIESWLQARNRAKLTIKTNEGEVAAEGLTSADALKLAALFK